MGNEKSPYVLPSDDGIRVYTNPEGQISIEQDSHFGGSDESAIIVVSLDRVDHLIRFLQAAKEELLTERADAAAAKNAP